MQQHADDDGHRQRVALVALVLPVQPDDLAHVDREVAEQHGRADEAEVHQHLKHQVVRVLGDAVGVVQVADADVGVVAAPEDRRVENAADRAAPDIEALGDVFGELVDTRQKMQGVAEKQRRGSESGQRGEVDRAPFLFAAQKQHDRADDHQHDIGSAAFRQIERDQVDRDQRGIGELHAAVVALDDVVNAEEDDERNVKSVIIRV